MNHKLHQFRAAITVLALIRHFWCALALFHLCSAYPADAADGPQSAIGTSEPDLAMKILKSQCLSCHNEEKRKGGLSLATRETMMKGGESGAAVIEGKPTESPLITSLSAAADPHMPPKKQLSAAQIHVLSDWVQAGAVWDAAALAGTSASRAVALSALPAQPLPTAALAISPNGSRLAAAQRNELLLFDLNESGLKLVSRQSAHLEQIYSLAWSPDGQFLVSGGFRRVMVWNAQTLKPEREITSGLSGRVTAAQFLADGKSIVIADDLVTEAGYLRWIDSSTGTIARSITAHEDSIFALALNQDRTQLASAGGDKMVKLWEAISGKEIAKIEAHSTQVLSLAFSPDGQQLVTGGADQQLKVWDVKTKENTIALATKKAAFNAVVWHPEGPAIIATTEDGGVYRYTDLKVHSGAQSSETGNEKKLSKASARASSLAVSGTGTIIIGTVGETIELWNKDNKPLSIVGLTEAQLTKTPSNNGPSFVRDVLPVMAKAGCAAGACHAKASGQNGFKLSVFSFDPQSDYTGIVSASKSRRVFPTNPEESLLLLKATQTIPHEGGEMIARDSASYQILREWIRTGMAYQNQNEPTLAKLEVSPKETQQSKGQSIQLKVTAHYSDGSTRDVTTLTDFSSNEKQIATVTSEGKTTAGQLSGQAMITARYMGLVDGASLIVPSEAIQPAEAYATLPKANFIDELAYARFQQLGLLPSSTCSDSDFLRRASLDCIGLLPSTEEAKAFLADTDPHKRSKTIDRLLAHPAYADHWATKWADLLRPNPDRVGVKSVYVLDQWIRESFRQNKPYDQFVREIVLTQGNTHRFGPSVIYRDRREPTELTTMFSQLFLGVRLDCAKCHHHPNEKWSQEDFYRMAAFFAPLKQKGGGISAPISGGNETFFVSTERTLPHPVTGEALGPQPPDGPRASIDEKSDPRQSLISWMADPNNPFFAKAAANRVWAQFFGKGIVDPVDDFRLSNPASHPALLDALAKELVRQRFDLKALMRVIMNSQLYQLSSEPNATNAADHRYFSRSYRRRMGAEMMADAIAQVTGVKTSYEGQPIGSRAAQAWSYKIDSRTMDAFGRPNSSSDCPCERNMKPAMAQALHLMNSTDLQAKLTQNEAKATVQRLASSSAAPADIVCELYLNCYSRPPGEEESRLASAAIEKTTDPAARRQAIEDVLWALLNSAEFVFNH